MRWNHAAVFVLVLAFAVGALSAVRAQQQETAITITLTAAQVADLQEALDTDPEPIFEPGLPDTVPTPKKLTVEQWVKRQAMQIVRDKIRQHVRREAESGSLDVSGLTRAQRKQIQDAIAAFKK